MPKHHRRTCGKWKVIVGRRRCCSYDKNHEGDCSWAKHLKDVQHGWQ